MCWQKSLILKCVSWAQLSEILKKQAGTEFSFTSYLQLDPGEAFSALHLATAVVQGAVQASLEAMYPIWLGMNPTAVQQSWWTWVCLRRTYETQISVVIPTKPPSAQKWPGVCKAARAISVWRGFSLVLNEATVRQVTWGLRPQCRNHWPRQALLWD